MKHILIFIGLVVALIIGAGATYYGLCILGVYVLNTFNLGSAPPYFFMNANIGVAFIVLCLAGCILLREFIKYNYKLAKKLSGDRR